MFKLTTAVMTILLSLPLLCSCGELQYTDVSTESSIFDESTGINIPEESSQSTLASIETDDTLGDSQEIPPYCSTVQEREHEWKGNGYVCISDELGIAIEFPPEWEGKLELLEESGEYLLYTIPQPIIPDGYDEVHGTTALPFRGIIGWINVVDAKNKAVIVDSSMWRCLPHQAMYDGDDVFVYIAYPSEPQSLMDAPNTDSGVIYEMICNGLTNGEFVVHIL